MGFPIQAPGGYVPAMAVDFAGSDGFAVNVSAATPLPVTLGAGVTVALPGNVAATSTPLAGSVGAVGTTVVGPFTPQVGRDIWATLVGTGASGSAQLLRSTDGGASKLGLTAGGSVWAKWAFGGVSGVIVNEQVVNASDAATYYLSVTLTGGSLTYRLGQ